MDFCQKIGTLSGSYDSAQTSSEETGSQLEKKTAFSKQRRKFAIGQRTFVRKLGGGMTVLAKLWAKKMYLESFEERGS